MGDQGPHEARIQAEQPEVVEEPNEAGAHSAQPAAQPQVATLYSSPWFNRYLWQVTKFHHLKSSTSNPENGPVGSSISNDFAK